MPVSESLTRIAVYERSLPVSEERVWENVRDWEHLPWLHGGSFSGIELLEEGDFGWRARISLPQGDDIRLELVIEDDVPRYVSRTLEGRGAGTEFWTPELPADLAEKTGDSYVELYTRLWDEDESMMVGRARGLAAARGGGRADAGATVSLGTIDELRPKLPMLVRFGGAPFRIVEVDGQLIAHGAVCPHRLGPLDEVPVEGGRVVCPWHGYAFDVATGTECHGRRMRLAQAPRVLVDPENGQVYLSTGPEAP